MAVYYVDLASGSDAAAGTAGAPLLTINAAVAKPSGPHDIRVAKTTAPTLVGGSTTITWTKNSVTVSTSTDLTASISAGNYIGVPTAAGNGSADTFYRVTSITSSTITLTAKYQGASTGTTTGCLKQVIGTQIITTGTAAANAVTLNVAGTTLSGGWNLSGTPTQDGETWFRSNNTRSTSLYGLIITAANCVISKINVTDVGYALGCTGTNVSYTNCSFYGVNYGAFKNNNTWSGYHVDCLFLTEGTTAFYTQNSAIKSFTNCKFYNSTSTGLTCATFATTTSNLILSSCLFAGHPTGISVLSFSDIDGGGSIIEYCVNGVVILSSCRFYNFTFRNNTWGAFMTSQNGIIIQDCSFNNNTGAIGNRPYGLRVENCTFTSNTNGISLEEYANNVYVVGCDFITPVTWGITKTLLTTTVFITDCTIDAPNESKLFNNITGSHPIVPNAIIKNSGNTLWPDGYYWPYFTFVKDATTHSIAPSMRYQQSTSVSNNLYTEQPITSCFAASGVDRTVSLWMKCNSTWAGTINPYFRLNGSLIQSETQITSLSTSWTQYTFTVNSGSITTDGELQLLFVVNANLIAFFVDDVSWS